MLSLLATRMTRPSAFYNSFPTNPRVMTLLIRLSPTPPPLSGARPPRSIVTCHASERKHRVEHVENVTSTPGHDRRRRCRLDEVCLERYPEYSRNVIQSWIAQGMSVFFPSPCVLTHMTQHTHALTSKRSLLNNNNNRQSAGGR